MEKGKKESLDAIMIERESSSFYSATFLLQTTAYRIMIKREI